MSERPRYPTNYHFYPESECYEATKKPWNGEAPQPVTVVGFEEAIINFKGYDIPDGFVLVTLPDGTLMSVHQSKIER